MRVDLNADVGEGFGEDARLIPCITSANIACGGHAGDEDLMRATVRIARAHGVAIGAHPSYPDREGFGRRYLDLPPHEVQAITAAQIRALARVAAAEGLVLQHVKPHGALFNVAVHNRSIADAIARATASVDPRLILFGLPASTLVDAGGVAGLQTACEAFADRAYRADGTLVPRTEAGAVIVDRDEVVGRAVEMAVGHTVVATDGSRIPIVVDTICLHGDTPGAANLAMLVRAALQAAGVDIRAVGS